jgi:hypothetical protein
MVLRLRGKRANLLRISPEASSLAIKVWGLTGSFVLRARYEEGRQKQDAWAHSSAVGSQIAETDHVKSNDPST